MSTRKRQEDWRGGQRRLERTSQGRREKTTVLIVCEGKQTEPNYFFGLKDEARVRARFNITVKKGPGGSAMGVVANARKRKREQEQPGPGYDKVWCVLDVEGQANRGPLNKAIRSARRSGIDLLLSNPSFEVWFLAHFERTCKCFHGSNDVVSALNHHWHSTFGQAYEKNDRQIYKRLSARTEQAIDNARKVREEDHRNTTDMTLCNSATEVYRLVEKLLRAE